MCKYKVTAVHFLTPFSYVVLLELLIQYFLHDAVSEKGAAFTSAFLREGRVPLQRKLRALLLQHIDLLL